MKLFDHCENEVIHRQDLIDILHSLGIVLTKKEQEALLKPPPPSPLRSSSANSLSSSGNLPVSVPVSSGDAAMISVDDALDVIARFLSKKDQDESLKTTFSLFSDDGPYIELHHLKKAVKELGDQTLGDRDLQEMIDHASNGSGRVSKEQFDRLMSS